MLTSFFYNNNQYAMLFNIGDNYITFKNYDTGKTYKLIVIENKDFTWKLNKKTVSAINGARGLFCFFSDTVKNDFMTSYLYKTLQYFNI